jgi:hypothetical protein
MTKKIGDKKLGGVKQTTQATQVSGADAVTNVTSIKATAGVGSIKGPGAISGKRRPTRLMTLEERQQLLQIVSEEADKMFNAGLLPAEKKEIVTKAVKMTVDASLLTASEGDDDKAPERDSFSLTRPKPLSPQKK